jgi:hypothetical protein
MQITETNSKIINKFFEKTSEKEARKTKFVQRKSPVSGAIFLKTFVLGFLSKPGATLNELTKFCSDNFGVEISSQALDQRINRFAVQFMKIMLGIALNAFRCLVLVPLPALTQFTEVNIIDSTAISLPDSLSGIFPGSGGSASKAGMKIQLIFEFLKGVFNKIDITNGITPDQKYTGLFDQITANSLNLFDLGYFSQDNLKKFFDSGAYFLTRFLTRTALYWPDGTRLNLLDYLKAETRNYFELTLLVGAKYKLPCRLAFFRVPEKIANDRRRKAREKARKKGYSSLSKASIEFMNWTILITNVPESILSVKQLFLLYSLRWQIELMFKLWKSELKIHAISGFRKERVLCEIYAKLIGLVLFQFLASPLREIDVNLSPTKAFKVFADEAKSMAQVIRSVKKLSLFLKELEKKMLKYAKREKRKTKLTTCEKILYDIYNWFLA